MQNFKRLFGERGRALVVIAVACDAVDFRDRYEILGRRTSPMIDVRQFDAAILDFAKVAQMKINNADIQIQRVGIELKRVSIERASILYHALPMDHKMTPEAWRIEKKFQRIRDRLKRIGRNFGPNNF